MKIFYLILATSLLFFCSCRQENSGDEGLLATVNGEKITLEEFRRFYELDPNFGIDSTGTGALFVELEKMICQKLALLKAEEEGLTSDVAFQRAVEWEKSRAMLRELYRQEVGRKIEISESELRHEFLKNSIRVHVRHLFSRDSLLVQKWRRDLDSGGDFDSLAALAFSDSLLAKNGGDLGWISLGELDEEFAEAAAELKKDQISDIVKTRWGYHLIHLLDRENEAIIGEEEYRRKKPALMKKIKNRKSNALSKEYIAEYIGALNPQPVGPTLQKLWTAIKGVEGSKKEFASPVVITNNQLDQISLILDKHLNEPLIDYRKGTITLEGYLSELKKIPLSNRPQFRTVKEFSDELGVWIRDKLLLEEAYRKNMNHRDAVKKEVKEFKEKQSYYYFYNREFSNVEIPPGIQDYFEKGKKTNRLAARYHTLQEWIAWQAEQNLHQRLLRYPADIVVDSSLVRQEARQIDWSNRIRMIVVPKLQ